MALAAVLVWLVSLAAGCKHMPKPEEGHIYDVSFGQVYCAREQQSYCGIWLDYCHDGHIYMCLNNVRRHE